MKLETVMEITKKLHEAHAEVEQLRVQLAGCSVAALGGTSPSVVAKQGQYGWSVAYQDVLDLRLKYENLLGNPPYKLVVGKKS